MVKKQSKVDKNTPTKTDPRSTGIRDLPTYDTNPFVIGSDLVPGKRHRTEIVFDGKQALINTDTGEVSDQIAMAKITEIETDSFVKVYASHMHILFDLGKPAQRVCEFVMKQVALTSIDKGEVILVYRDYQEYFAGRVGSGRSTFLRGLDELAQKKLIAKTRYTDIWYINPAIIFNGKRARFITELRRKNDENTQQSLPFPDTEES